MPIELHIQTRDNFETGNVEIAHKLDPQDASLSEIQAFYSKLMYLVRMTEDMIDDIYSEDEYEI